ncbi:MAG TPA: sigma 54-interacting transcriptional regulator [Acidobacteriaceae bacterium]|nr:sigma 54-interacting transcriptional regulator [Acidobacteriaceae bacterium]
MQLHRDPEPWLLPVGTKTNRVPELISRSLPMRRICEQLQQAAEARLILIEGEAGTGKQLLARHIRWLSPAPGTLTVEEAATLSFRENGVPALPHGEPSVRARSTSEHSPNQLLERAVERSAQGVLLLRGIDQLNTEQQSHLLRFIRTFETAATLGNSDSEAFPFQVICTTCEPLRTRVLNGKFLAELYYRLSAVCLSLPPLRERKEDIPGLARLFIESFARERRKPLQGLGPGALAVLLHHRWPGNVRELESVIRAACFAAEGQWLRPIDLVILPLENTPPPTEASAIPEDLSLDGVLRRHVQRVLKLNDGNKARAAAQLGISRSTLYRMLESDSAALLPESTTGVSAHREGVAEVELTSDSNDLGSAV